MKIHTTLHRLKEGGACSARYEYLKSNLGPIGPNDPIDALDLLKHNGVGDTEWLLNSTACIEDPAKAWAEYRRVRSTALAEHERVRSTALAEYERVTATAWAEHERVTATAWAEVLGEVGGAA